VLTTITIYIYKQIIKIQKFKTQTFFKINYKNDNKKIRLGIISTLAEEQAGLILIMQLANTVTRGMRDYVTGKLWAIDCVCVLSRIGKVAAAATVGTIIERFDVTHIIFTGVAGSAAQHVNVGDIVIAQYLIQHDMDTSPLAPRFEVPPLTGFTDMVI
jgi:adenosylhomocysteine nucleosidase